MIEPAPRPWLVFSDDWGRHPSSCQHLVRALLPGQPVTWVNTIGTRPLRLDRATAKRGAEKLRGWFGPKTPTPDGSRPVELGERKLSRAHVYPRQAESAAHVADRCEVAILPCG